jgi:hypothetical protein
LTPWRLGRKLERGDGDVKAFPGAGRATVVASLVLLACAGQASAATKVVSFDDLPADTQVSTQYQSSHGVYFRGPDVGDGWLPVTRSVPAGVAHSGSQVGDISNCTAPTCEGFVPRTVGTLVDFATTVSAYVGFRGSGSSTATMTLTARDPDGNPIASSSAIVTEGAPFNTLLSVTAPAMASIASFELSGDTSATGLGMDDLSITTPGTGAPDISLAVGTDPVNVRQGDTVDVPISVNRHNGSNGDVSLSASGLPPGMSASFVPNPVPGAESNAKLRLTAAPLAPTPGNYSQATITATPGGGAGSAPRTAKRLVRVVENCVHTFRSDFLDVRTDSCMREFGSDVLVAHDRPIRINGLAFTPEDSSDDLVIDKKLRTITSRGKEFSVTPVDHPHVRLFKGTIDWNLGGGGAGPKQVVDDKSSLIISGGGEEPLADIFFVFRVDRVAISLTKSGKAQVNPDLKLGFFPFDHFGTTTVTTGFLTDNDHGSSFDGLAIKLARVTALGLELKDVSLGYQSGGTWSGGATLVVRFAKPFEVGAAFGLKEGDFDYLRASISGLNTPVGPAIFLQRIGLGVQRHPLSIEGTAGFSAGPSVLGAQVVDVNGVFKALLDDPFVLELNGTASLIHKYFGDRFKLGNAFVRYTSTGLFELGGDIDWDLKVASANAHVSGFVDGFDAADLEGRAHACISIPWAPDPCAGADFLISNIGVAGCVELGVQAGLGYEWGGDFDAWWGSCDLGPWRPAVPSAHTSAARRFNLRRGLPSAAFAVDGVGYAPGVTLTGPHGESISVSRARPQARVGRLFASQGEGTTYVVVKRPAAGTWTLTDDGSVPIRRVRQAVGLPRPSVHASVSGRARRRTLHWRLRPIQGQRVRFIEVGRDVRNVIATTRARRGQARFRPFDGAGDRRRIVALVDQNGLPRARIAAGSYRAPPRLRPGRPRHARIRRRGTRLIVSWRAPRPGFRHAVYLRLGDGRRLVRIAGARQRSVKVSGVAPGYGAAATISGLTHANGRGPSARAAIAGRPARPAAGRWRLRRAFDYVKKGAFRLMRGGKAVTSVRVTPGALAARACGRRELRMAGRRKLTRSSNRAGLAIWILGRSARRTQDGASPIRVRVAQGRKRRAGTLELRFDGRRRALGELRLRGCQLFFEARK